MGDGLPELNLGGKLSGGANSMLEDLRDSGGRGCLGEGRLHFQAKSGSSSSCPLSFPR